MKLYSAGFFFDVNYERVLLITKARPDWQKGKLNGIGGHVEEGETFRQCMRREFEEETGISTFESDWTYFAELNKEEQFVVQFFKARGNYPHYKYKLQPTIDEPIGWYLVHALPDNVIFNLRYYIMMALDTHIDYPVLVRSR